MYTQEYYIISDKRFYEYSLSACREFKPDEEYLKKVKQAIEGYLGV